MDDSTLEIVWYIMNCVSGCVLIFSHGVWPLFEGLQDLELQRLAAALPDIVLQSWANTTIWKYLGVFRCWAKLHSIPQFTVKSNHLALYLQHVAESAKSKAAVEEAANAIAWLHSAAGIPNPGDQPFVTVVVDELHRMLAKPTIKKEPISVNNIMLMVMAEDATRHETLSNVRLTAACLLAYAGFLHFDELAKLRPVDLLFDNQKLTVIIR